MARREIAELSVEEKLKTLFQLQTSLSAIDEKKALRGELPLEVQDLEDEIEGTKIRIEKIQNEIDEFQKAVSDRKADILEAQTSVARYKSQLDEVKNNREYDTLSKEIEFQTLEIELCNKKIREAQKAISEKIQEKTDKEQGLEELESELDMKRSELDDIIEETRAEEDRLKVKVKELEAKIDPRLLASFKRTALASSMFNVTHAAVALTRFHLSASSTSRCTRRSSCASIADVSSSTLNWQV